MSGVPARPSAIVFDWDNTLVDTWPTIHEALSRTFEAMAHEPWSFDETKARVRHSLRDSFPVLFGDRWTEARDVFYDAFKRCHIEQLAPIPGAAELLSTLSADGMNMAVLSNKTGRYLRDEADHLGWTGHFAALVGAGDAEQDKPARQALELALGPFGCEAGPEVWIVGDSVSTWRPRIAPAAWRFCCIATIWPPKNFATGRLKLFLPVATTLKNS